MPPDALGPLPILFTHFGDDWIRGSETLLLDLMTQLDPARFRPVVWCNGQAMADACGAAGFVTQRTAFTVYLDAGSPRFSAGRYLALVREGRALAARHGCRVLHANSAAPTQWLLPVARAARLPLLTHLHIGYLRRSRYALLLHQADLLVGVSRQVLDAPLADGVPAIRTQIIYNGIDFGRLDLQDARDLRSGLDIPAGAPCVGAIGSLVARKGFDVLIRAIAQLPAPYLLIAGDGPDLDALRALAARLGVAARVRFLGYCRAVGDLYRTCDVIALASRADAFGLVLAEAGFAGLPVVATRVGGIPEVILDGQTGLLVPPDDADALAAALGRLLADPAARARLGSAAKARAKTHFSAQRMAAEFQDAYARLAALPRAGLGWSAVPGRARPFARLLTGRR